MPDRYDYYDDEEDSGWSILAGILGTVAIAGVVVLVAGLIAIWAIGSAAMEKDSQGYSDFLTETLGVQGEYHSGLETTWDVETLRGTNQQLKSVIEPFRITYWNGQSVLFYIPQDVWDAVVAAQEEYPWCPAVYNAALAFSEGTSYDNVVCSDAGACRTWQFLKSTYDDVWTKAGVSPIPDMAVLANQAKAVCLYTKGNGMIAALDNKQQFITHFAQDPPVWNAYPPQAEFVWNAYKQAMENSGSLPEARHTGVPFTLTKTWWKQPLVWYLKLVGILPEKLQFDTDSEFAFPSVEGDDKLAIPYPSYTVSGTKHGEWYGNCAVDLTAGNGASVYSPINGTVTQVYMDNLGNPIIHIENSVWTMDLYHGNWNVEKGQKVKLGEKIGTESNQGNTWASTTQKCGTGSSCGYHTHWSVFKKGQGCVDPLTLVTTRLGEKK